MKVKNNLFYNLPQELIIKIYSYDPTYRMEFDKVLDSLPKFVSEDSDRICFMYKNILHYFYFNIFMNKNKSLLTIRCI